MRNSVHARLDEESSKALRRLRQQTGWKDSEIIRRGIRLLAGVATPNGGRREIIGLGKFASGISNLGSNKDHLKGFGSS